MCLSLPAKRTADASAIGCAKLVIFANAVPDNPFMAGAFHGFGEGDAAISVGIVGGVALLDLPYVEDSTAEVDMNLVMTESGRFVEVQGTAEGKPFSRAELDALLDLAEGGIAEIVTLQRAVLATPPTARA